MRRKSHSQLSLPLALLLTGSLSLVLATSWLVLTGAAALHLGLDKLGYIAQAAETTPIGLITQGISGWFSTPTQTNHRKNILVLGTDSLRTRGSAPPLTDTILLMSLNLQTGEVKAISLPRDTWSETYQSRINAVYATGLQRQPATPTTLVTQEISSLTDVPIHHTVVISLEEVAEIIDLLGGVSIDVPVGFIDTQFPRPEVDVTVERNPAKLYQTIEFKPGVEVMNGERALQYIRSRHAQGAQGSDDARAVRQQLVIQSLLSQLLSQEPSDNVQLYGKLFAYYRRHFARYISFNELIATAKVLYPNKHTITFEGRSLSIYPQDTNGVLYHPPENTTRGMWLYKIKDVRLFQQEVQTKLYN